MTKAQIKAELRRIASVPDPYMGAVFNDVVWDSMADFRDDDTPLFTLNNVSIVYFLLLVAEAL